MKIISLEQLLEEPYPKKLKGHPKAIPLAINRQYVPGDNSGDKSKVNEVNGILNENGINSEMMPVNIVSPRAISNDLIFKFFFI